MTKNRIKLHIGRLREYRSGPLSSGHCLRLSMTARGKKISFLVEGLNRDPGKHLQDIRRKKGRKPVFWVIVKEDESGRAALHIMGVHGMGGAVPNRHIAIKAFSPGEEKTAHDILRDHGLLIGSRNLKAAPTHYPKRRRST